jgi:hypothetical protein
MPRKSDAATSSCRTQRCGQGQQLRRTTPTSPCLAAVASAVRRPHRQQADLPSGPLVLLGLILSTVMSGFCAMARLLAVMPWNKLSL